jgi:murein L,D-transpeptidase YafK
MRAYRLRLAAAAAAAALLAGCVDGQAPESSVLPKHLRPLSTATVKDLESKGMSKSDPVLVRIYKKESELEVWKRRKSDGRYAHFKTYGICKWSGELGPKVKIGDRQAPEGFYTVTPGQMNPNSSYHLSFNTGFPNAFDRALGRTGQHLMVHGACSSAGCYAMTDAQMQEIYSLMRDAFDGGQKSVQVQAYPFRMTARNLARHRGNPNMPFWRNLKEGNDHFEVTGLEPKIEVCGKRYVFNAEGGGFSPSAACPAYRVKPDIAVAVAAKAKKDETEEIALAGLEELPVGGSALATLFAGRAAASSEKTAVPAAAPAAAPAKTELAATVPAPRTKPGTEAAEPVRTAQTGEARDASGSSLFALSWLRPAGQPAAEAPPAAAAPPAASALVAPAAQPATQGSGIGGVKGFFGKLLGRSETAPAPTPASDPQPAEVTLPAPKPRERSARLDEVLPPALTGAQPVLPSWLSAYR